MLFSFSDSQPENDDMSIKNLGRGDFSPFGVTSFGYAKKCRVFSFKAVIYPVIIYSILQFLDTVVIFFRERLIFSCSINIPLNKIRRKDIRRIYLNSFRPNGLFTLITNCFIYMYLSSAKSTCFKNIWK